MASKKEIEEILKELGITREEMQKKYVELQKTNKVIRNFITHGIKWEELNSTLIRQIPTQMERDIEGMRLREERERESRKTEEEKRKEKEYYEKHFEEIMVKKIDNEDRLTEREIKRILEYSVDTIEGVKGGWTQFVSDIVKLCGRYFRVDWRRGLTESQESEYEKQPYEVRKHEYYDFVKMVDWLECKK